MTSMAAVSYDGDGGMVALYPEPSEAEEIAQPGGQPAGDLHVTLCFLPDGADLEQIGPILAGIAEEHTQLSGTVSGVGKFQAGEDGVPSLALPSVLGMNELRTDIARSLADAGIEYATNYGWIPHMTLGYDQESPESVIGADLSFNQITFVNAGDRHDYALRSPDAPEGMTASASTVPVMSNEEVDSMGGDIFTGTNTFTSSNGSTITITVNDSAEADSSPETSGSWESVLAVEGSPSSDRRYLIPDKISERELPLPLRVVTSDSGGHDNAVQVGRIENIQHIPITEFDRRDDFFLQNVPDTAVVIWGEGVFDGPEDAVELAQTMIRNGAGISLDLPHDPIVPIDAETLEEVPVDDVELSRAVAGEYLAGIGGKIAAATIVDIPAFEEATIRLSDGEAIVASAFGIQMRQALVASVGLAPLSPPKAWFEVPEPDVPTPLTVTDDGQVFGHLATWNQCHGSFPGQCELAPKSRSNYKFFHLGSLLTAEGDSVQVGRITVGKGNSLAGGHYWDLFGGSKGAIDHYDKTGTVGAFVRAKDGRHGIWICGATRSDASPEAIRDMRANPPSGDWRWENGGLEMVAALSVPVPGYPVPYLMSSSGDHPLALIATGYVTEEAQEKRAATRSEQRKMASLVAQARGEFLAMETCPDCGGLVVNGHTCMTIEEVAEVQESEEELAKKKKKEMPDSTSYAEETKEEEEVKEEDVVVAA